MEVNPADGTAVFVIWTKINKGKSLAEQINGEKAQPLLLSYASDAGYLNMMQGAKVSDSYTYFVCATKDNYIYTANDFRLDGMLMCLKEATQNRVKTAIPAIP